MKNTIAPTLWGKIGDNATTMADDVKKLTTTMGDDVTKLQSSIKSVDDTIGTFYSVDQKGKVTLTANILDAPTAIVDVLKMYPWQIHSSGDFSGPVPNATLNFCVKDPADLKNPNAKVYNPIFFKYDNTGNLGQVWANRIQSPGFVKVGNGPTGRAQWLGYGCPGV